jgi:hypothetical protein
MATLRKIAFPAALLMFRSPACARGQVLSTPVPNCPDDRFDFRPRELRVSAFERDPPEK